MDMTIIQIIWTIVSLVIFVGIVIWAWSSHRKQAFDDAANLPFDSDDDINQSGENTHG